MTNNALARELFYAEVVKIFLLILHGKLENFVQYVAKTKVNGSVVSKVNW